jgi:hypothetical protein
MNSYLTRLNYNGYSTGGIVTPYRSDAGAREAGAKLQAKVNGKFLVKHGSTSKDAPTGTVLSGGSVQAAFGERAGAGVKRPPVRRRW